MKLNTSALQCQLLKLKMPSYVNHLGQLLIFLLSISLASQVSAQALAIDTEPCPADFNSVKIPTNGKLCQVFATEFPASMIMHVPLSPSDVIAFYEQESEAFPIKKEVKSRVLLQSADKNTTLIISADGSGTQVDILVKEEV